MGLESTSWDWLRDGVKRTLPAYSHLERVENGVSAGMADVNYLVREVEGWIELKAVELPKRASTRVLGDDGLNLDQINWHMQRQGLGGRTWVLISAKPYRWLLSGAFARDMNDWNVEQLSAHAHAWHDSVWKPAHWHTLVTVLHAPKIREHRSRK